MLCDVGFFSLLGMVVRGSHSSGCLLFCCLVVSCPPSFRALVISPKSGGGGVRNMLFYFQLDSLHINCCHCQVKACEDLVDDANRVTFENQLVT